MEMLGATLDEVIRMKVLDAKEQVEAAQRREQAKDAQLEQQQAEYGALTRQLIDDAVKAAPKSLGFLGVRLWLILHSDWVMIILITILSSVVGIVTNNALPLLTVFVAVLFKIAEMLTGSTVLKGWIAKKMYPCIETAFKDRLKKNLRAGEKKHEEIIVARAVVETPILKKCRALFLKSVDPNT